MGSHGAPRRQSRQETVPLGMTVLPRRWPSPSAPSKLVWPGRGQTLQADLSSKQLPALSSSPGGRRSSLKLADGAARVLSVGTDTGKTHTFPAVKPSTGGNLRNWRSLLHLSQAIGEASIPPFNKTGNTWGPKPDQTRPLRPVNADTFGVTLEAAATGTV